MSRGAASRRWIRILVAVAVLTVATLAVVLVSIFGADFYIEDRSSYCTTCHEEQALADHLGGHAETTCQACHQPPEGERIRSLWPLLHRESEMPSHGGVLVGSCAECHQQDEARWRALMSTPGHMEHAVDPGPESCTECHGLSLHGEVEEPSCMECHDDIALFEENPGAELACTVCHSFSLHAREAAPRPSPGANSDVQTVTVEHIHGAADCRSCHNPHDEAHEVLDDCRQCHRGAIAASMDRLPEAHQECRSCHQIHALRSERAIPCAACHANPRVSRPEAEGVADDRLAPSMVEPVVSAATMAPGPIPADLASRSHQGQCLSCHSPHGEGPWVVDCQSCHEDQFDLVAALPREIHADCTSCHEPHSVPPTSTVCGNCHRLEASGLARTERRHRDCLSCHRPHEGSPEHTAVCSTCHANRVADLASGPAEHRRCEQCHNEHQPPRTGAVAACEHCHDDQRRDARRSSDPNHRRCSSCHEDHTFSKQAASHRCEACHERQVASTASHRRDPCITCHTPHGPTQPAALDCRRCHEEISPRVAEHRRCQECHSSHEAASQVTCDRCHEDQVRWSRSWPADNPHGGACKSCHQPHDVRSRPECSSCHAEQSTVVHTGTHRLCSSCHPTHRTEPPGELGWWTLCERCHQAEAIAASEATPSHRRCIDCHNNPRRVAPSCRTCHETASSELLHTSPSHGTCRDCHLSHSTDPPHRRACVACHEDRRNHYPDAARCQGCHPFTVFRGE